MAFTKVVKDMGIIAALDDLPNETGGLTAAQLKAKFDESGASLKTYINDTLVPEIESSAGAASLGAKSMADTDSNIQGELDARQLKATSTTVTLTVEGWANNAQTVSATGVTAINIVLVAPAPASQTSYVAAGVKCTTQGAETLSFSCDTTPAVALTVNVVILP